uniref:Uncharacterized protein n=1 Tax=Tanacetum cinerariifolium TaxID=118510 RepID=A0A699H7M6_TANCI|nr:hypothetical protein [Tanacetum cinerariifolium]
MDEALVPHAQRLRIGRSNFRLLSDIKFKESTLQLVYDVLRICSFFKAFLVTADVPEIYMDMLHICLRVHGQSFAEPPFEEEILAFIRFLGHSTTIRTLTDVNINKLYQPWRFFAAIINKCLTEKSSGYDSLRLSQAQILNSNAYKEYYAVAIGAAPPKPKASVRRTRSSSDISITPPIAASPRLTAFTEGKQTAKASKAKSLSALFEVAMTEAQQLKLVTKRSMQQMHISQVSSSGTDEGTSSIPGVLGAPTDESEEELSWNSSDDEVGRDDDKDDDEEGGDDKQEYDDEEYAKETRDEESFDHILQTPKNGEDEGDGMESIFEITSQLDVQTPTSVAPLPITAPTMNPSTIATITTTSQAPILPTTALSSIIQDLPNFGLLFGFDNRLRTLEANFFEFRQMNQFAGAISFIPGIVNRYMDQRMNEAMNKELKAEVLTRLSHSSKTSYAIAADLLEMELKKILIEKMEGNKDCHLKRRRDNYADKDEEPSAGPDWGSKRCRQGKEPDSASAPIETATRSASSLVELEYHSKEVFKATTDQLDWVNPEGQQYLHNLLQPLPLIPNNRGRRVIPFEHFINNDLEYLRGGASSHKYTTSITKMKVADYRHIKSPHWGRKHQQFYGFAVSRESAHDVYSKRRIIAFTELKIVEWHSYKHLDWITMRRDDDKLYKFKEGDFKRLRIQDIEDMLLLLRRVKDLQLGVKSYQKKLNLTKPDTYRSDMKHKEAYTAYFSPQGFIYQNKNKKKQEDHEELREVRWRKAVRGRLQDATKDHMIYRMLLLSFKSKNMRIVPIEMELILEHTQQDISHEVSVSAEGVEELKRNVKIKGVKKEAILTH